MRDESVVNGLLAKREELLRENADLRERMAVISNDIEAIDRVLDAFGYPGELKGGTPRQARIVLFYRNELREYLLAELRKAEGPLSSRELASPGSANVKARTLATAGSWRTLPAASDARCARCERLRPYKASGISADRRFGRSLSRSAARRRPLIRIDDFLLESST